MHVKASAPSNRLPWLGWLGFINARGNLMSLNFGAEIHASSAETHLKEHVFELLRYHGDAKGATSE